MFASRSMLVLQRVQWFCLIFWRLFDGWTSYFWMSQCDIKIDFNINVGHSDLYLTVHLICFMSSRVLYGWTSNFRIMSHCVAVIALIALLMNVVHSWCSYLEQYFIDEMQCLKFINLKSTATDKWKRLLNLEPVKDLWTGTGSQGASERSMDWYCRTGSQGASERSMDRYYRTGSQWKVFGQVL